MTTTFETNASELLPLIAHLAGDLPPDELESRFARATWSGIVEPGDGVAGALIRTLGPRAALALVVDGRPAGEILAALLDRGEQDLRLEHIEQALARWKPRMKPAAALTAVRQAVRQAVRLCCPGDEHWPAGLDDLGDHAPIALWVHGNLSTLKSLERSIALVGARAATGYGEHVTMEASAGLVDRGYSIVSGAAYGIDGMAHRAALASSGQTVAFLAGGVDRLYPSGHEGLLTRIIRDGAVVSELPCGSSPTKWRFLQRNRLISASSLATVVLEAGHRSGSINTAGHAATLGRPLGAVPGPVTSAASAGCHRLIREFGATCVTDAEEMAELAPLAPITAEHDAPTEDSRLVRVVDALSTRSARTTDDIAARSGLSVAAVRAGLGELEVSGRAAERPSGWVSLANSPGDGRAQQTARRLAP
jgi:DNA processing protein